MVTDDDRMEESNQRAANVKAKKAAYYQRNKHRKTGRSLVEEQREQVDLSASLEHLIATGCKRKRDAERRQEFRQRQEMILEQQHAALPWTYNDDDNDDDGDGDEKQNNNRKNTQNTIQENGATEEEEEDSRKPAASSSSSKIPTKEVLTEDIRIYGGKHRFAKRPWPNKRKRASHDPTLNNSDKNWEIEHGDSIHPLAFSAARLSQQSNSSISSSSRQAGAGIGSNEEFLKAINGSNLHISATDTSLPEEHVPRALLLRCWERAVHAASMTIPTRVGPRAGEVLQHVAIPGSRRTASTKQAQDDVPSSTLFGGTILGLGGETTNNNTPIIPGATPVKEPAFVTKQQQTANDRSATRSKCISLGISLTKPDLPPGLAKLTCPVCPRTFENAEALRQHYYGGPQGRGCCWHKIPEKQTDVIAQILKTHVNSQVDEILGLLMERAKERIIVEPAGEGQTSNQRRRLLNWHDILMFTETTFQSSHLMTQEPVVDARNGKHPLFDTLQRKSEGVPLVLNPSVLYTARERLVDRYANLPL